MDKIIDSSGKLCHIIWRKRDFKDKRVDIIAPENMLQCSALKLEAGKSFRPHRHLPKIKVVDTRAQESWVVIEGEVKFIYYGEDDELLGFSYLFPGDASFTLYGGHTFEIMEDSLVMEMKTGPYLGQELDKVFIDD